MPLGECGFFRATVFRTELDRDRTPRLGAIIMTMPIKMAKPNPSSSE